MLPWRQTSSKPIGPLFTPGQELSQGLRIERILSDLPAGVLYLGRDARLDREVAIAASRDMSTLMAQARGIEAAPAQVRAAVFQLSQHKGIPYLVGERVHAPTLRHVACQTHTVLQTVDLIAKVAEALVVVHQAGITIGDLTSGTVLVDQGRVLFSQFALGQCEETPLAAVNHERRRKNSAYVRRRDVYSLALMAVELLLGRNDNIPRRRDDIIAELRPIVPVELAELLSEILDSKLGTHFDAQAILSQLQTVGQRLAATQQALRVWIADADAVRTQRLQRQVLRTDGHVDVQTFGGLEQLEAAARGPMPDVIFVADTWDTRVSALEASMHMQSLCPRAKLVFIGGAPSPADIHLLYQVGVHRVIPAGPSTLVAAWEVLHELRDQLSTDTRRTLISG